MNLQEESRIMASLAKIEPCTARQLAVLIGEDWNGRGKGRIAKRLEFLRRHEVIESKRVGATVWWARCGHMPAEISPPEKQDRPVRPRVRIPARETRARIMELLSDRPMTIRDLIRELDMNQPAVAQHMTVLLESGAVTRTKLPNRAYLYEVRK